MVKFPSQNKLTYQTGDISYTGYAAMTSGGTSGHLNLPKDLSITNRRGYASTTRKGVPLVYRTKLDLYLHDEDGAYGPPSVLDNLLVTLKISGVQNNWVARNAAVKWHAAREALWKAAGIKRKDIGSWAKEVRYCYDDAADTWLTPIDGDGDAFAGGTWDLTAFVSEDDPEFVLKLVGSGTDEDASFNADELNFMFSYLSSRATVPADSNLESSDVPATNSKLQQILNWNSGVTRAEMSYIQEDVDNVQDNPPYHEFGSGSTTHDVTEPVELGRCLSSTQAAVGSAIVDIPFGICDLKARAYTSESTSGVTNIRGLVHAEVLDIYEMQG